MNCKTVQISLSAYLDGELAGSEMLEVRHHVQECAVCAREAEELRTLKTMLASSNTPTPPADFEARLVAHVFGKEQAKPAPSWRSHIGIAGVAAAAAVAAFVVASKVSEPIEKPQLNEVVYSSDMSADQLYYRASDPLGGAMPVMYEGQ